jgi:hypothetical protein
MSRNLQDGQADGLVVLGSEPQASDTAPGHDLMPTTQTQRSQSGQQAVRGSVDLQTIEGAISQVDQSIEAVKNSFEGWAGTVNCSPRVHALAMESQRILNEYRRELQFDLRSYSFANNEK